MIRALIFDFDGIIIDTDWAEFQAWQEVYHRYQYELPLEKWVKQIGRSTAEFDAYLYLETLLGYPLEPDRIKEEYHQRYLEIIRTQDVLPGVRDYLLQAQQLNLKVGLASNSTHEWVEEHLTRFGLLQYFHYLKCGDEITYLKPDPEVYLAVLEGLHIASDQAIAFEDSISGVYAAQQAHIFCVMVPNKLIRQLTLPPVDLKLHSLSQCPLPQLIAYVEN